MKLVKFLDLFFDRFLLRTNSVCCAPMTSKFTQPNLKERGQWYHLILVVEPKQIKYTVMRAWCALYHTHTRTSYSYNFSDTLLLHATCLLLDSSLYKGFHQSYLTGEIYLVYQTDDSDLFSLSRNCFVSFSLHKFSTYSSRRLQTCFQFSQQHKILTMVLMKVRRVLFQKWKVLEVTS